MTFLSGDSVRALDGFFRLRFSCDALATTMMSTSPPLFAKFVLETNSWDELERKRHDAETSATGPSTGTSHVKIVYFVRHAEGFHNAAEREFGTERWEAVEAKLDKYLDADLTAFGIQETKSKGPPALEVEIARGMPHVGRVVVSTLSRAIQTADFFFPAQLAPRPFISMELCRETLGVHTCDKRRSATQLRKKFPDVAFTRIRDEEDMLWSPMHRETSEEVRERAHAFLLQLFREVEDPYIAVVTHSGFISAVWSLFHSTPLKPANCEVVPLALEWVQK